MRFGKGAVGLLAVIALVGGCSSAAPAPAPGTSYDIDQLVAAVAQRQRTDQTARLSLRGELIGGSTLQFTGEGVLRVLTDAVSVKFTQIVIQQGVPPQETGFVVLPDATYLRLPPPRGQNPSARPWVRVDPKSTDPAARRLAALATTLTESADPARSLARYTGATAITAATADIIDGDPAVRYTIVTDLAKAAATAPDPARKAQLQRQVAAGLATVTSTLWVDPSDRPVRSSVRQELPGIGTLAMTGSYRDWGRAVDIEPPPASQVR
jgi:hypothetical protein